MVIALFALSLVMIVGGIAAVVQGFPYVRLESGLAMVIGGTTAASAGAVLLGLAVATLQMRRLASALGRRGAAEEPGLREDIAVSSGPVLHAPAFEAAPPMAVQPVSAVAGTAGLAGISLGGMRDGRGSLPAVDPLPEPSVELEPPLPNLLPPVAPGPLAPAMANEPIIADEDLFASPEDRPGHGRRAAADEPPFEPSSASSAPAPAQEEMVLRPALEEPMAPPAVAPPVPEAPVTPGPAEPDPEPEEPQQNAPQVVGTYASGANTYVMYADGTIQADTPRGQFTFQSLDELKEFVDSGGETNTRGAA